MNDIFYITLNLFNFYRAWWRQISISCSDRRNSPRTTFAISSIKFSGDWNTFTRPTSSTGTWSPPTSSWTQTATSRSATSGWPGCATPATTTRGCWQSTWPQGGTGRPRSCSMPRSAHVTMSAQSSDNGTMNVSWRAGDYILLSFHLSEKDQESYLEPNTDPYYF